MTSIVFGNIILFDIILIGGSMDIVIVLFRVWAEAVKFKDGTLLIILLYTILNALLR